MNTKNTLPALALALIAATSAPFAFGQASGPTAAAVVTSEPGKAAAVSAVQVSAKVVAIDKATRVVTLKGPQGKAFDIVAGDQVKNFDQIKVGDAVVARYMESLTLELQPKGKAANDDVTVREGVAQAKPGERPAAGGARQVTLVAKVTAVDPQAGTITLTGPKGKAVPLKVQNPDQFKVVKVGDRVEVTYTEALALSVEPAAK
jgi:hypothetical protein